MATLPLDTFELLVPRYGVPDPTFCSDPVDVPLSVCGPGGMRKMTRGREKKRAGEEMARVSCQADCGSLRAELAHSFERLKKAGIELLEQAGRCPGRRGGCALTRRAC